MIANSKRLHVEYEVMDVEAKELDRARVLGLLIISGSNRCFQDGFIMSLCWFIMIRLMGVITVLLKILSSEERSMISGGNTAKHAERALDPQPRGFQSRSTFHFRGKLRVLPDRTVRLCG